MLGILQIAKGSPWQHRVYDPDRQDRTNSGEVKCHLYFFVVEIGTLRERFFKVRCSLSESCMG